MKLFLLRVLVCLCAFPFAVDARAKGFRLIAGEASAPSEEAAGHWKLISGKRAIVEWDQFSLAQGEIFRFCQADAKSTILNRVVGGSLSEIFGAIQSNGAVFLINPSGILIGVDGRIETAGFLASTFDLSNEHFLSGKTDLWSSRGGGAVINLGIISCPTGDVTLIARHVVNEGMISAPCGKVLLETKGGDWIQVDEGLEPLKEALREGSPYAKAICQQGFIEAEEITLYARGEGVEVAGELTSPQGTIHVLGEEIRLTSSAMLDASGANGGGTILIGGDYQGKNPEIPNVKRLYIEAEAQVFADALEQGNGGKIIFWSDEETVHHGQVFARGGPFGGDGGFVEISSKGRFDPWDARVNTMAPQGKTGRLLYDPRNVAITGAATSNGSLSGCPGSTFTPSGDSAVLNVTSLTTNLASCNVLVQTTGGGGSQAGTITVSTAITWATTNTLTLTADSSIAINSAITNNTDNGGVAFSALSCTGGQGITIASSITTKDGNISLTGNNGIVGDANWGISMKNDSGSFSVTASGAGNITISGTSSGGSNYAIGVFVRSNGSTNLSVKDGTLSITGQGGSAAPGGFCSGIWGQAAIFAVTGTGSIILQGTGGAGGTGGSNHGVTLAASTMNVTTASTGTLSITGFGGSGTTGTNHGIDFVGDGSVATTGKITASGSGNVTLIGIAGGSNGSYGINLPGASIINATAASSSLFSLTGCGSGSSSPCSSATPTGVGPLYGINIAATNAINLNTSSTARISLTGTGGPGSGGSNYGVRVANTFNCPGALTIVGTGGSGGSGNFGTFLGVNLVTVGNAISITGTTGLGANVTLDTTNSGAVATGANISLVGAVDNVSGNRTLSLTAGTGGGVTFGSSIGSSSSRMSLTFNSGNALSIGGSIFLNSTAFSPASTMPATLTATSTIDTVSGSITFPSTVVASSAGSQALTLTTTGAVALNGNIGATRLGALTVTSGASGLSIGSAVTSIAANSFTVEGTIATTLVNSGTATIDTSAFTGGSIAFGGTIIGTVAGSQALTLTANGTGSVTLSGNVGATRLGAFTIGSGGGGLTINTGVTSIAANSFTVGGTVPTTLANTATLTINTSAAPGVMAFGGLITGTDANTQNLTLQSGTSNITCSGAIGAVRLATLAITSANNATFSSSVSAGAISQAAGTGTTTFSSTVNVNQAASISLTGTAFTFGGAVTGSAGGVTVVNSGVLTASSAASFALQGAFTQTGGGSSSIGANIDTNNNAISFLNTVTISSACTFTTDPAPITFSAAVEGPGALTLIGSTVTFSSTVGATTALAGLDVTATAISIAQDQTIDGATFYRGATTISSGSSITLENLGSGGLTFGSTLTSNITLFLLAPSTFVTVTGAASTAGSGAGSAGKNLTVNAGSTVTFSSSISSIGGSQNAGVGPNGGHVSLTSTGGSIIVTDITTSGTNGTNQGGAAGNITLQPATSVTLGSLGNIPNGRLILGGDLTALGGSGAVTEGSGGSVLLSPNGRFVYPSIATIASTFVGNGVVIQSDTLTMGANESMTILGSFSATISSSASVRDIIALDGLVFTCPALTATGHGLVQILNSSGGLEYITGGHFIGRTVLAVSEVTTVGSFSFSFYPVSQSSFLSTLTYAPESYVLNFGIAINIPSPTSPTSRFTRGQFIQTLGVDSSSYQSLFPLLPEDLSQLHRGRICNSKAKDSCLPGDFESLLLKNGVTENFFCF